MKKKHKDIKKVEVQAKNIKNAKSAEHHVFMKLGSKLRAYFFTGILVTAPVAITFYMAYKIILWIDAVVAKMLPPQLKNYYSELPFTIPGLGVVVLIVAMIIVGMFAAGFVGRFFIRLGEWIVKKVPLISSVYSLLKQIFESFLSQRNQTFNQVVLLEYPRKGLWILGFVSTDTGGEVKNILQQEMINVFIPTTPNPTSGFLIFVPRSEVRFLDMSVEEGLKFVISCGIVIPDEAEKLENSTKKVPSQN